MTLILYFRVTIEHKDPTIIFLKQKISNSEEERGFEFQNYLIIRFKYLISTKYQKAYKKISMAQSNEKVIN